MRIPQLSLIGLLALTFTLATQLGEWQERYARQDSASHNSLQALLGESQRLFSSHFITKADVYLHGGVYPSIFDQAQRGKANHLTTETTERTVSDPTGSPGLGADHEEIEEHSEGHDHPGEEHDVACGFLGKPRDWIDAFGRHFYPTVHIHLDENGNQREILPWLRLAADLNPNEVQTYTLGAYWLRNRMGKVAEAEEFLREGWRANPTSYEILFELGRLKEENQSDPARARNLMEAAQRQWQERELGKEHPDEFALMQITGHLARLELRDGRFEQAICHLEELRAMSPNPESIQMQLDEVRAKLAESSRP